MNIKYTQAYYLQHFAVEGPKALRNVGLCVGIYTMIVVGWAVYYAKIQAEHLEFELLIN